jgi:hypothetical protein
MKRLSVSNSAQSADRAEKQTAARQCDQEGNTAKPVTAGGSSDVPPAVSNAPPSAPPVAIAKFHAVVTIACARSTPSPNRKMQRPGPDLQQRDADVTNRAAFGTENWWLAPSTRNAELPYTRANRSFS